MSPPMCPRPTNPSVAVALVLISLLSETRIGPVALPPDRGGSVEEKDRGDVARRHPCQLRSWSTASATLRVPASCNVPLRRRLATVFSARRGT
jgi:hypothetical protein